jgi:hypothetical protein
VPDVQPDVSQQVTSIYTYFDPRPAADMEELEAMVDAAALVGRAVTSWLWLTGSS